MQERLDDPAFYEKMSALLDEVIKFRKERAVGYEQYLKKIAELTLCNTCYRSANDSARCGKYGELRPSPPCENRLRQSG